MDNKSAQIKLILAKIKIEKIIKYLTANPQSKTLKKIIRYSQRAWESNDLGEVSKLAVRIAYYLDWICDPNKTGYVKNKNERKYWLEISKELFANTVGLRQE